MDRSKQISEQDKLAYLKARDEERKESFNSCAYFRPLTAEEKREREEDIKAGRLPF